MSDQTISRGFKFRLYPTAEQESQLWKYVGACRLVYNLALEQRRDFWRQYRRQTGKALSFASQSAELTQLRAEYDWIAAVPSAALTYALRDVDRAFQNFFAGRAAYPRPRKKGRHASFHLKARDTRAVKLNGKWGMLRIPNLGLVRYRQTREMGGEIRSIAVAHAGSQWFVSFGCDVAGASVLNDLPAVGIDRGISRTVTLSNGEHHQVPAIAGLAKRRGKAQRVLARRKRGSKRYAAQRARVAALRAKEARIRTDWCHRTSTDIARRFGLVAIEALNIPNMTASAKGTIAEPGRMVRQKAGLNRAILAQGWGRWADMLNYKLADRGGHLITVPAQFTSQTCASCGVVDASSRESQAVFLCVACGHRDNADVNAAKEILRRCTSGLDVDGAVGRRLKRQPQGTAHA